MIKVANNLKVMLMKQGAGQTLAIPSAAQDSKVLQMPAPVPSPNARDIVGGDYADKYTPYFPTKKDEYAANPFWPKPYHRMYGGQNKRYDPISSIAYWTPGFGGVTSPAGEYAPQSLTPERFKTIQSSNIFSRMLPPGSFWREEGQGLTPNFSPGVPFKGKDHADALNTMIGLYGVRPYDLSAIRPQMSGSDTYRAPVPEPIEESAPMPLQP